MGRIEQMRSDSDSTLTQRDHEPLVSQRLIQRFRITAAADFDATKYTALRSLPRTRHPISVRKSLEQIANQGLIVIMDPRRGRIQHELQRRFHDREVEVVYRRRLGRIPAAQGSSRTRIHKIEAREALHVLR